MAREKEEIDCAYEAQCIASDDPPQGELVSGVLISVIGVVISIVLSTAVNWYLGPKQRIREDKARDGLDLKRELRRILKELQLHLANEELQYHSLEEGGHAALRFTITRYAQLLHRAVRMLDDPDLPQSLVVPMRDGFRDLIGSWRLEYLTICDTPELENVLDRFRVQPPEQRHLEEKDALIPVMCRLRTRAAASDAIRRVSELISLVS
jgi:hypothetical protein